MAAHLAVVTWDPTTAAHPTGPGTVGSDTWMHALVAASHSGSLDVGAACVPLVHTNVLNSCIVLVGTVATVVVSPLNAEHADPLHALCARAARLIGAHSVVVVSSAAYSTASAPQ